MSVPYTKGLSLACLVMVLENPVLHLVVQLLRNSRRIFSILYMSLIFFGIYRDLVLNLLDGIEDLYRIANYGNDLSMLKTSLNSFSMYNS